MQSFSAFEACPSLPRSSRQGRATRAQALASLPGLLLGGASFFALFAPSRSNPQNAQAVATGGVSPIFCASRNASSSDCS